MGNYRLLSADTESTNLTMLGLRLWGEARLEYQEKVLPLRKKSLALLYYLAFEKTVDRQKLAELLWENNDPQGNLRVELHYLRKNLSTVGIDAFTNQKNWLTLPEQIKIIEEPQSGMPLLGLERLSRVSEQFEDWLEWRKQTLNTDTNSKIAPSRDTLLLEILQKIRVPSVLVLEGLPGSQRTFFARDLARKLNFLFVEGQSNGGEFVLQFFKNIATLDAETMVQKLVGVVVLARSAFGETPRLILELEQRLSPEQLLKVRLPPLVWSDARRHLLATLSFDQAAHIFLISQGLPGQIQECLDSDSNDLGAPQILNQLQLELRFLPLESRIMLENLAVCPTGLSDEVCKFLGADVHVEEFERRGWFVYTDTWQFKYESVRRLLMEALQPGRRLRMHQRLADFYSRQTNQPILSLYHSYQANPNLDWQQWLPKLTSLQQALLCAWRSSSCTTTPEIERRAQARQCANTHTPFELPLEQPQQFSYCHQNQEIALLEAKKYGTALTFQAGRIIVVESVPNSKSGLVFAKLSQATLLRISGRIHNKEPFGFGISGQAIGLAIGVYGTGEAIQLQPIKAATQFAMQSVLPSVGAFEYWIHVPAKCALHISSQAMCVVEVELTAYATTTSGHTVEAYRLEAAS